MARKLSREPNASR